MFNDYRNVSNINGVVLNDFEVRRLFEGEENSVSIGGVQEGGGGRVLDRGGSVRVMISCSWRF